jgi:hypothetical protein
MNTRPIDEYLDFDIYSIETDANGDKIIHVDGYVYQGDGGLMHQQAIGCYIHVSDIQGWDYERILDNIHDTFDLCNQTVGEISEQDALEMYSKCKELPFDIVNNDTPDGLYVNIF